MEEIMRTATVFESLTDQELVATVQQLVDNDRSNLVGLLVHLGELDERKLYLEAAKPSLFAYCVEHDIQPIGYCPLGSPSRPERDRTADDTVDLEDPVIIDIAKNHGIHPASVCIKWAIQRGQIPIPFSIDVVTPSVGQSPSTSLKGGISSHSPLVNS